MIDGGRNHWNPEESLFRRIKLKRFHMDVSLCACIGQARWEERHFRFRGLTFFMSL